MVDGIEGSQRIEIDDAIHQVPVGQVHGLVEIDDAGYNGRFFLSDLMNDFFSG